MLMTGRKPGMLRGDGTKTRHVPSRGWVPARLRTAAQSLAYPRTGTRKPSHSRTAGRSPAYLQTEVQELSLLRAAAWGWICRPFPGGTICWAEPAPACRKKKGPGKAVSQHSVLRSPQAAIHKSLPKAIQCGKDGRNRNSVIFGDMRLENDIFVPVCAWGVFPTRPERPPLAPFRFGLTRHVGRLLHRQSNPAWRAIPPVGKEVAFFDRQSPRIPKGTRGPFHLSLLFKGSGGNYSTICWISTNSLFSRGYLMAAGAAASRARGTRKGLQET